MARGWKVAQVQTISQYGMYHTWLKKDKRGKSYKGGRGE
jgi:hypothetical protein